MNELTTGLAVAVTGALGTLVALSILAMMIAALRRIFPPNDETPQETGQ